MLNGGLSFTGDIVPIGSKDVSLLYEYWCFLRIVSILSSHHELEHQTIVKTNRFKTTTTLAKGKSAALRFKNRTSGSVFFLVYNKLFDKLPTINQKPDNVIQLADGDKFYIFDAKYRVQFNSEYVSQYGGEGPTTDDINTMHRYRDAIAIPNPMRDSGYDKGVVIGAAVLFPYPHEDEYRKHRFYKSLDSVEIGGIPFMPNATSLMEAKLLQLLQLQCT